MSSEVRTRAAKVQFIPEEHLSRAAIETDHVCGATVHVLQPLCRLHNVTGRAGGNDQRTVDAVDADTRRRLGDIAIPIDFPEVPKHRLLIIEQAGRSALGNVSLDGFNVWKVVARERERTLPSTWVVRRKQHTLMTFPVAAGHPCAGRDTSERSEHWTSHVRQIVAEHHERVSL